MTAAKPQTKNISILKKMQDQKVVSMSKELANVREQLEQKTVLLDKVKVLLHRAAAKEKYLLQEVHIKIINIFIKFISFRLQS